MSVPAQDGQRLVDAHQTGQGRRHAAHRTQAVKGQQAQPLLHQGPLGGSGLYFLNNRVIAQAF